VRTFIATRAVSHPGVLEVIDASAELEPLRLALAVWETVYNTIRPHQALGYLTPAEYLASVGVEV